MRCVSHSNEANISYREYFVLFHFIFHYLLRKCVFTLVASMETWVYNAGVDIEIKSPIYWLCFLPFSTIIVRIDITVCHTWTLQSEMFVIFTFIGSWAYNYFTLIFFILAISPVHKIPISWHPCSSFIIKNASVGLIDYQGTSNSHVMER